jgi:hypothetical protein
MVQVVQRRDLRLVLFSISLQSRNPLFHRAAKPGTDLKPFIGSTIGDHGKHLEAGFSEAEK